MKLLYFSLFSKTSLRELIVYSSGYRAILEYSKVEFRKSLELLYGFTKFFLFIDTNLNFLRNNIQLMFKEKNRC